jgi:hypothetical protein
LAITFKEQFTGFCRHCDKPVLDDAEFCHHCGKLLLTDISEEAHLEKAPVNPEHLKALLKETSNLFLIWCCCISFMGATALIYYFYHSVTPIIIGSVAFVYVWIFLIAKLDELAIAIRHTPKQIAYLSLFIPIIGTIFCYQKIDNAARLRVQ